MLILDEYLKGLLFIASNPEMRFKAKAGLFLTCKRLSALAILDRLKLARPRQVRAMGFTINIDNYLDFYLMFIEIFAGRVYAFRADTPKPMIIDAGSNIGMAALYFKYLYPQASVLCFEPGPEVFSILQSNLDLNHLQDVQAHPLALLDKDGEVTFYVPPSRPGFQGMGIFQDEQRIRTREIKVKGARLSAFVTGPVDLLKLEVEAAEETVLKELKAAGKLGLIKQMIIEYHLHFQPGSRTLPEFLKFLNQEGFEYLIHTEFVAAANRELPPPMLIHAIRK